MVISATEIIIAEILAPALGALSGIAVDLRSEAVVANLAGREADLAIRMSRPEGNSLVIRRLAEFRLGLFAAPALLAGRDPAHIDLRQARIAVYDDSFGRLPELAWLGAQGLSAAVVMRSNSTRALLRAAESGACIALLPHMLARPAGLLEVPLPQRIAPRTAWLTMHRDLRQRRDIGAVKRWVVAAFAARRIDAGLAAR